MALIGNYSILNRYLVKQFNGVLASGYPEQITPVGMYKNRFSKLDNNAATPNGYLAPGAWVLPMTPGGMSSYTQGQFTFAKATATLVNAQYMTATGAITFAKATATISQILAMSASSNINFAKATATLAASVPITASGTITFAKSTATLGASLPMNATGVITFAKASGALTATAFMTAAGGGAEPLSPEGLAAAVWNAAVVDFNEVGTMGEKLNDAGSGSNPWTEVIESGYTAADILKVLAAFAAGKTSITPLGGGDATVVFRDLGDTKDRIEAGMEGSERTAITLDTV